MKRTTTAVLAGTASLALAATVAVSPAFAGGRGDNDRGHTSNGKKFVGLTTTGTLVTFGLDDRDRARDIAKVSGLAGDTALIGIDYRVQNGLLYGVGNSGGVYTISTSTAAATKVSQLTVALDGTSFDIDFNPAADRLRIVSNTGQNLRHNVNAGGVTLVDTALTYPPATATATGITGAAYTNNDLDADTATTLFDLDTTLDQVALQSPANSGQLVATGKLGVDAGTDAGFDIYNKLANGQATGAKGYATLSVGGAYGLYSVSLLNGDVHKIRSFAPSSQVVDLAIPLATS